MQNRRHLTGCCRLLVLRHNSHSMAGVVAATVEAATVPEAATVVVAVKVEVMGCGSGTEPPLPGR